MRRHRILLPRRGNHVSSRLVNPGLLTCFLLLACFMMPTAANAQVAVAVEEVGEVEEAADDDGDEWAVDAQGGFPVDRETAKLQAHLAVQRAFVRRVCKLTKQQEKKVKSMDNKWLTKISNEKQVVGRGAVQQPGLIGMFFGVRPQQAQVVKKQNVKKRINDELLGLLNDDQKAAFDKELKKRNEFRSSATADALIETLQDRLDLTDEQRSKIKEKLLPWVKRNPNLITMYYFGNGQYPEIPIHLLAALTNEQRKIYQGLQRYLYTDDNFHNGNQPIVIKE